MSSAIAYPAVRRDENYYNSYHGTSIADPYVWLEDPDSEETKTFVEAQNKITTNYLINCEVKEKFYTR